MLLMLFIWLNSNVVDGSKPDQINKSRRESTIINRESENESRFAIWIENKSIELKTSIETNREYKIENRNESRMENWNID